MFIEIQNSSKPESIQAFPRKERSLWKARLWPSGDFTIGYRNPPKRDRGDHPLEGIGKLIELYAGYSKLECTARQPNTPTDSTTLERVALMFEKTAKDHERMAIAYQESGDRYRADKERELARKNLEHAYLIGEAYARRLLEETDKAIAIDTPPVSPSLLGLSDPVICHKTTDHPLEGAAVGQHPPQNLLFENLPPPSGGGGGLTSRDKPIFRARRGSGGITPYAKKLVRSAGAILEENFRGRLSLLTCTLPTLTESELRELCKRWGRSVFRVFMQRLTRVLRGNGLPVYYVAVTEIQEKRFESWGQVCPHIHVVFVGRSGERGSQWVITPQLVAQIWGEILDGVVGRSLTRNATTRIESPRKSLQKELGKYLTKGGKVLKKIKDAGLESLLPNAWHGVSKELRQWVKRETVEISDQFTDRLVKSLDRFSNKRALFYRELLLKNRDTGKEMLIGYAGFIRDFSVVIGDLIAELQLETVISIGLADSLNRLQSYLSNRLAGKNGGKIAKHRISVS